MKILIVPFIAAKRIVTDNPNRLNVISIGRDTVVDSKLCKNHLLLQMDDIQDWHIERWDKELKEKGIIYPEKEEVIEALNFDKRHKVHLIHCAAGVSRSPAIAYVILRGRGLSESDAMKEVKISAPQADPNPRIIRIASEIFN